MSLNTLETLIIALIIMGPCTIWVLTLYWKEKTDFQKYNVPPIEEKPESEERNFLSVAQGNKLLALLEDTLDKARAGDDVSLTFYRTSGGKIAIRQVVKNPTVKNFTPSPKKYS